MVYQVKSKQDLEAQFVQAGDKLVVVDFFATWCGPCKRIAPLLETIAAEKKDKLIIVKLDVDEIEECVSEYSINVMPTFVFKRNGKLLETLEGSNEDKLKAAIEKHLAA